jgi:TolB-like protein/Tfp pilus assembly protein PilF
MDEVKAALDHATRPVRETPSIAVLPFASMSPGAENEYFSDGISEEIINVLTQIDGLHVAARTSSFSFKGKAVDAADIARRLNVRHLLDGSVRTANNRVRVTAQLTDASTGFQVWSERYDRQLADIFDVQDDIARAIVDRLKVAFAVGPTARLVKATTDNIEAYQEYLKARAMLYCRGPDRTRARKLPEGCVARPALRAGVGGVADRAIDAQRGTAALTRSCPPHSTRRRERRSKIRDRPKLIARLAIAALLWERDFRKAEREFVQSLTLNPRISMARCWYGLFFLQWGAGRYDEGLTQTLKAFEDDPLSAYVTMVLSLALASVGRFEEALRHARQAVEHDPQSFVAHWELGYACHCAGRHDEAVDIFEPLSRWTKHNRVSMGLAAAYARAGRLANARAVYESMLAEHARDYMQPFSMAVAAEAVGDHEAAMVSRGGDWARHAAPIPLVMDFAGVRFAASMTSWRGSTRAAARAV